MCADARPDVIGAVVRDYKRRAAIVLSLFEMYERADFGRKALEVMFTEHEGNKNEEDDE